MYWNYRIVKENDEYLLCEVYYDDNNQPTAYCTIIGAYTSVKEVYRDLNNMLKDISDNEPLNAFDITSKSIKE